MSHSFELHYQSADLRLFDVYGSLNDIFFYFLLNYSTVLATLYSKIRLFFYCPIQINFNILSNNNPHTKCLNSISRIRLKSC